MSSYPWVDHAWLQSTAIALTHPIIGKIGLAALYAVLAILAVTLSLFRNKESIINKNSKLFKNCLNYDLGLLGNFIFLLSVYIVFTFYGVRVQVVSWILLAILLEVILGSRKWKKYQIFLPAFFSIWANLHGSFALGILVLFFVFLIKSAKNKRIDYKFLLIVVFSFIATFINPYKAGVWKEVWSSISDTSLRWSILEWMPTFTMLNIPITFSIVLSSVLIWKHKNIYKLEELILYLFFLLNAIASRRHLPLWIIVALPLVIRSIQDFYIKISKIKNAKTRFKKAYKLTWIVIIVTLIFQFSFTLRNALSITEESFYPKEAVHYLKINKPQGEIFSKYGWGGYLIWKYPEKKVFIDGRMPSWRWKDNPSNETDAAFDDYRDLLVGDIDYQTIFEKYGVDTVLWCVPVAKTPLQRLSESIENYIVRFGWEKKDFSLFENLQEDGWEKVYDDDTALIYKKPN
ncbi:MAG: hypothetical protein JSW62_01520 [Thermoplasmatales archaeon]|nr:MAG: hypothetical protein JSW62_01520 [Thermoplasmatales archaeon]